MLDPWQMTHDRVNQLNLRVVKILRRGRTRIIVGVDIFNALNSSAMLTPDRLQPGDGDVADARERHRRRFANVSAPIDFGME